MIGAIVGPTAAGKSAIAMAVAAADVEIISVDSMQVYRGMDVGTAKPTTADRQQVPHHMVDVADPAEPFSVAEYQHLARHAVDAIERRPLLVGGSGLHFRSIIDPLEFPPTDPDVRAELEAEESDTLRQRLLDVDPDAGDVIDLDNRRRLVRALEVSALLGETPTARSRSDSAVAVRDYEALYPTAIVGVDPGPGLADRVTERVDAMLEAGWVDEVAGIGDLGPTAAMAVGYRELGEVVRGEVPLDEARLAIIGATMALAKRQRTYFRRDPRVRWVPWRPDLADRVAQVVAAFEEASWTS